MLARKQVARFGPVFFEASFGVRISASTIFDQIGQIMGTIRPSSRGLFQSPFQRTEPIEHTLGDKVGQEGEVLTVLCPMGAGNGGKVVGKNPALYQH